MSTPRMVLCAVIVVNLLSASTLEAQAPPNLEGIWEVTWAQGVRTEGDELVEVQRWGQAVLTLSVSGDSVSGAWQAMGVTWRLSGTYQGGRLRLESPGSDADDPQLARMGLRLIGALSDDRLEGEIWLIFRPGGGAPRPWRAIRRVLDRDSGPGGLRAISGIHAALRILSASRDPELRPPSAPSS